MIKLHDELTGNFIISRDNRKPKFLKYDDMIINLDTVTNILIYDKVIEVNGKKIGRHRITFQHIGSMMEDYDYYLEFKSSEELKRFLEKFLKIIDVVEIKKEEIEDKKEDSQNV